ncbi:MAG: hypothetical protein R3B90_11965 [Planctomycetaceae bacterium]
MTQRDRWIRKHLGRLHVGQFLQRAGEWFAGFLIVFGMIVLLVSRMAPQLWPNVLWLAVAAIPVAAIAWWLSQRGRFTRDESVALLDRSLGVGGLLMSLTEVPDQDWERHLPSLERRWQESMPRLRPKRFLSCVGLPALFALAMCVVPLRHIEATGVEPPLTAGQQAAQRLEQLLDALKEAELLEEKEEEELAEEIAKIVEETHRSPLTHEKWETVDALEQRMRTELMKAQLDAEKLSSAASLLLAAAKGEGLPLSDEQLEELEEELLETLIKKQEQAASESSGSAGSSQQLQDMLQRLTKNGTQRPQLPTDAAEREQLLDELKEFLDQEQQALEELRERAGAGNCQKCGQGTCQGQCSGEGKQPGQCSTCGGECKEGQGTCANCQGEPKPGRGGVNRGRGDAELTWGQEANEQGVQFKEAVLPPGFLEDPKDEVVGVKLSAPEVNPADSAPRAAVRADEPTTGRESWKRTLRPRHKAVVRDYFDTER